MKKRKKMSPLKSIGRRKKQRCRKEETKRMSICVDKFCRREKQERKRRPRPGWPLWQGRRCQQTQHWWEPHAVSDWVEKAHPSVDQALPPLLHLVLWCRTDNLLLVLSHSPPARIFISQHSIPSLHFLFYFWKLFPLMFLPLMLMGSNSLVGSA